jgi:hypothetical protein
MKGDKMSNLDILPLSLRAKNVLKAMNVTDLESLLKVTMNDLSARKNCGQKTINEIISFIESQKNPVNSQVLNFSSTNIDEISVPYHVYNRRLDSIFWSARAFNLIKEKKLNVLADLARLEKYEILDFKNTGQTVLKEVESVLNDYGLSVGIKKLKTIDDTDFDAEMYKAYQELVHLDLISFTNKSPVEVMRYFEYFSDDDVIIKYSSAEIFSKFLYNKLLDFSEQLKTEREKYIYEHRIFPVKRNIDEKPLKLEEIGQIFNCTRERIRQSEQEILNELQIFLKPCDKYFEYVFIKNRTMEKDVIVEMNRLTRIYKEKTFDVLDKIFSGFKASKHVSFYKNEYEKLNSDNSKIRDSLVSVLAMPADIDSVVDELNESFGFDNIQIQAILRILEADGKLKRIEGNRLFVIPSDNNTAVANILLRIEKGLHEDDITKIYNEQFSQLMSRNETNRLGAACSTQNPSLFWVDKKTYAHVKFLNLSADKIDLIQAFVFQKLKEYEANGLKNISAIKLYNEFKNIYPDIKYYLFRYVCANNDQFLFDGTSNKDVVSFCKDSLSSRFSLKEKILQEIDISEKPLSSKEIKDRCFLTKSHMNFNLKISELIDDGKIVRLEHDRFCSWKRFKDNFKEHDVIEKNIDQVLSSFDVPVHYHSIKELCETEGDVSGHYPASIYKTILNSMNINGKKVYRNSSFFSYENIGNFNPMDALEKIETNLQIDQLIAAVANYYIAPSRYILTRIGRIRNVA